MAGATCYSLFTTFKAATVAEIFDIEFLSRNRFFAYKAKYFWELFGELVFRDTKIARYELSEFRRAVVSDDYLYLLDKLVSVFEVLFMLRSLTTNTFVSLRISDERIITNN
ncbi:hypothetical protein GQX74_009913 [Glossina fuscipes]|nr:hypothetical protein GQX74_009913 [Glossina fuscipes]